MEAKRRSSSPFKATKLVSSGNYVAILWLSVKLCTVEPVFIIFSTCQQFILNSCFCEEHIVSRLETLFISVNKKV